MNKRNLLFLATILIPGAALAQQKPNIVFILADDMRGSAMNFLGKENVKTPNIDKLAADGMWFENNHIMGGTSGAVSMPSRAMLITGKHLNNLVKQGSYIPDNHTTLGQALGNSGYNTFHIGKWHADRESFNRTFKDGDHIFFGGMSDPWNIPLYHYHKDAKYQNCRPIIEAPFQNNHISYLPGEYVLSGLHAVDIFTDRAVNYIEETDNSEPFFINVAFTSPHDPRSTYDKYQEVYDDTEIGVPDNFLKEHPFDNGELRIRDEKLAAFPRDEKEVSAQIKEYYAMISHVDESVGRIIDALKEKGIYDNTIVIFSADNGLAMGQHGLMGKQNVYEHSVGVPLIIKDTEGNKGVKSTPCYLIDVMPTLLDYAGVEKPESVDSKSLMPSIKNNENIRPYLYYQYIQCQRSISDMEWKLIEYNVKNVRTTQLFHLSEDPKEMMNLADNRKYKRVISSLRKEMLAQKAAVNDNGKFWEGVDTSKWSK